MSSDQRPEIFMLSLSYQGYFDESYASFINEIHKLAKVKRAKALTAALRYLEENDPHAILITDEGLTEKENKPALDKVKAYVQNGGVAIVGFHFTSSTNMDRFDDFFKAFGVHWEHGDYHRTDFSFNQACTLPSSVNKTKFPATFSMKVLHIKNAQSIEKIFVPASGAKTQSRVFPPSFVDSTQAAAAGIKLGKGYLYYVGDVNGEDGSSQIILALCSL